jgi:hypothetical protein
VARGIFIPLPTRESSKIRRASLAEKPIFIKAEKIIPRKRDPSPKIKIIIKIIKNVRLNGM